MKTHPSSDPSAASTGPASSTATPSASPVELERAHFRQLLVSNPNYFGNFPSSGLPSIKVIAGNTTYEQLHCVGFDPERDLLEATIHLKRSFGYKGGLCADGSTEFVRFYLDYGSGWEDVGVASFNAHDIPNSNDCAGHSTKPLVYVVTHRLQPRRRFCRTPVLPRVRAILSWETPPPPNTPNWPPVWGHVLERHIQIKPRPWTIFGLFDTITGEATTLKPKLPKLFQEVQDIPIPIPEPGPLSLVELAQQYGYKVGKRGTEDAGQKSEDNEPTSAATERGAKTKAPARVEAHRFGLPALQAALSAGGLTQANLSSFIQEWAQIGLSWKDAFEALQQTKANVSYEELTCVGLDYNREWLVATVQLKRPAGYSGTLCYKGSEEHVAFWADWEDKCEWTYLGTVSVPVHDFAVLPDGGLHYAAILPVNLNAIRRHCSQPRISRVRAVLSWSTPPSTIDPDDLQTYGNRLDAHVQVRPGPVITAPIPHIRSLGGIPIEHIDTGGDGMTRMVGAIPAKFWFNDAPADPWGLNRDCPFGGQVLVHGMWFPGYKYRLLVKRESEPASSATPLLTSFNVTKWTPGFDTQLPDSTAIASPAYGFFSYLNPALYLENNLLGVWNTSGDEKWEIKLQLANGSYAVLGETPWLKLQLDNTPPVVDIHISNGGDCKGFNVGDTIIGDFVARDAYFGSFSLDVLPDNATTPSNEPTTAWPSTTQTPTAPGAVWNLNTGGPITMKPCGYVARVVATSRTIVGSASGGHHHASEDVGFYLLT